MKLILLIIIILAIFVTNALCEIDERAHIMIESSGNQYAVGKDGERGLYQCSPIGLRDYNNSHPECPLTPDDLFSRVWSHKVWNWMVTVMIPRRLEFYQVEITDTNVLFAYNLGCYALSTGKTNPRYVERYYEAVGKYNNKEGE